MPAMFLWGNLHRCIKQTPVVLIEDKMSLSVHVTRQRGLLFLLQPRLRSTLTSWTQNTPKRIEGNFLHNVPVATASSLQPIQTRTVTYSPQRQMCTHGQVDTFTQLPLVDSQKGRLIYSGPLSKTIRAVKIFSLSTSGFSLCVQPMIMMQSADMSLVVKIAFGSFFSFFAIITPLLIHMVAKKYVTGVYFEPDSKIFTAAKYSFFCRQLDIKFTAEDVKVPEVAGPFTSLIVKGKALFMDPKFFLDKNAYIHLMGFDKPLDWEMPKSENQEKE